MNPKRRTQDNRTPECSSTSAQRSTWAMRTQAPKLMGPQIAESGDSGTSDAGNTAQFWLMVADSRNFQGLPAEFCLPERGNPDFLLGPPSRHSLLRRQRAELGSQAERHLDRRAVKPATWTPIDSDSKPERSMSHHKQQRLDQHSSECGCARGRGQHNRCQDAARLWRVRLGPAKLSGSRR